MPSCGPTGATMTPPTRTCSRSASGTVSPAAVTMMRSKGACSGQPLVPSPTSVVMLAMRSVLEARLGGADQRPKTVDGVDPPAEPRQDRRLVAGAGADLEHAVAVAEIERRRHHADDHRRADGLPAVDRQRPLGVGLGPALRRHEDVARHQFDRRRGRADR